MSKEGEEANAREWLWPEWTKRPFFDVWVDQWDPVKGNTGIPKPEDK